MLTGNKGEWSEVYTLLKIISEKKLFAGDGNLSRIENLIFPIIKILRDESNGTFQFGFENDLVVVKGGDEEFRLPIKSFQENAYLLLTKLKSETSRTFSYPAIEDFINSFGCKSLKAKSTVKSDIKIVVYDQRTGSNQELGFSIKSQIGGASTLLNAGRTTNFIYKVEGVNLSEKQIEKINQINSNRKIKDRIDLIQEYSGVLKFDRNESTTFKNNLMLIDSALPEIVSHLLHTFFTTEYSKVADLSELISSCNPVGYNLDSNHPFYEYKIKRLLTEIALGMMPSKVWTGKLDATGGYLVVKEDGEVLCYHIYNRNDFEDYLYQNTKFETASSSRHHFGSIYTDNDEQYFNLNLQIRFLK